MARRGQQKKMNLGEFLGDNVAYTPEAALPSGPRIRAEGETDDRFGGRGGGGYGDRRGGDRFEREPSRSDESSQWRGDRGGDRFGDRGGDRFGSGRAGGDRFGGDRFSGRDDGGSWRGGGGASAGPSRYDRPSYESREEERPSHMRLNLQRRTGEGGPSSPRAGGGLRSGGASDDKFGSAFGSRGGASGSRFGNDRDDRFGDDRRGGGGYSSSRFGRDDARDDRFSNSFGSMRMNDNKPQERNAAPAEPAISDKKARAQQMREERKKKAEEERLAAEEAKRVAAEEKKKKEEEAAKQAEADRKIIKEVLDSGKKGDALAAVAKDVYKKLGRPSGAVVVEAVTVAAEDVAKASANWIALTSYGALLKLTLEGTEKDNQVKALYALQVFLNTHDFPKGLLEKCFMALYSLDIIEDAAFFEYKYDVDSDVPGRMKAIIQTSTWLTWLETPEEEEDEDDE